MFYIGGTKCGALMGEALVILNDKLKDGFRYIIKQHGGLLAKDVCWVCSLKRCLPTICILTSASMR